MIDTVYNRYNSPSTFLFLSWTHLDRLLITARSIFFSSSASSNTAIAAKSSNFKFRNMSGTISDRLTRKLESTECVSVVCELNMIFVSYECESELNRAV